MPEPTVILGIETSCDETACAIVADGRGVLAGVVASQVKLHARYGGVVPEVASRAHIEAINTVIGQTMDQADLHPREFDAVAVTHEPGLIGSLLVGLMAAKTLAWVWERPLVGVNHVYAHAYSAALDAPPLDYPAVALICSGGHTAMYHCRGPMDLELIGSTMDDAAGEAFDKVAGILQLGYPGGPAIDRVAKEGNPRAIAFPRSLLEGQSLDFSFSGLKTAVLYHVRGAGSEAPAAPVRMSAQQIADIAASFQAAVVDTLIIKLRRAARQVNARTLILGGGVAANSSLRAAAAELASRLHGTLRMPALPYCVDNAAMIAGLAYHYLKAGRVADLHLDAYPTVRR